MREAQVVMLRVGECYSRREIHEMLGGELISYLPQRDGDIVCGCFCRDGYDPNAPDEVLVGRKRRNQQKAWLFCEQDWAVPVFLKLADGAWQYVGDYQVDDFDTLDTDCAEVERKGREAGRDDVTMVLYLEKAPADTAAAG